MQPLFSAVAHGCAAGLHSHMSKCATYGYTLHQNGKTDEALRYFLDSETLQQQYESHRPCLHSLRNFYYCSLLLDEGKILETKERTCYSLAISKEEKGQLSIGLDTLLLGVVYMQSARFFEAGEQLNNSVNTLVSRPDYLAHSLLARAALHRHTRDFARAQADLQEVFDIADGSGMRLHLTDYHLEMARLLMAEPLAPSPLAGEGWEGGNSRAAADPAYHIAAAAKLIKETGYHRRDHELLALQAASGMLCHRQSAHGDNANAGVFKHDRE